MAEERKKLNFIDCLGIGIGLIIGSGVMVLTGVVVGLTGMTTVVWISMAIFTIALLIYIAIRWNKTVRLNYRKG